MCIEEIDDRYTHRYIHACMHRYIERSIDRRYIDRYIDKNNLRIAQHGYTEMGIQPFPAQLGLNCIGIQRNVEAYKRAAPSLSTHRLSPAEGRKTEHG